MKKLLALLMAVAMLVSIVACGESKKEENVLDTKNPILSATANLLNKFANEGGTITLSAKGEAMDMLSDEAGVTIDSLEFKTDTEQVQATLNGKIGETVLSESIYYGGKNVVVNSPAILGGAYGINLGTLEQDFDNSAFAPNSGNTFALPEETVAQMKEMLGMLEGIMSGESTEQIPGLNIEQMTATISNFSKKLIDEINKLYPAVVTEENGYTITTITVTSDKFGDLFNAIADLLEEEEMKEMLSSVVDAISEYAGEELPVDVNALASMVRSYGLMFTGSVAQYGISATSVATIKVRDDGMYTEMKMSCEVNAPTYGLEGSFEYSIIEEMTDSADQFEHNMTIGMNIGGLFEEELDDTAATVLSSLEEGIKAKTVWNKKTGDITITEELGGQQIISLEGNLKLSNTEMTFVYEKIEMAGMVDSSEYIDNVTLEIKAGKPKGLKAPSYVNVLTMSSGDILDLMETIEKKVEELGLVSEKSEETAQGNTTVDGN